MNIVLWVIAGLLAAAFLMSGAMKVVQSREKLIASGMGWAEDFPPGGITAIGILEVLGAIGLILPAVTGVAPILVPFAATGLALVMAGAMVVHARRRELPMLAVNAVLLILAAVVAWGRFGPYAFSA
ncbi:DoxX family protein [Catenuloplanes atrovinosus]|uniref:Membrane protein n=1 Tax=Catenuloplanes atrovinosus TaxID=137266 RepID=A0AAE4CBQ3_9ACTN|nr:DoxX family protein [Catenuloplanes atrovinosus]MDR7275820.1 putative membrane protein [Catenuloplanes atrovinosus]